MSDTKNNSKLSQEMIDNIKSYGQSIETIEDPVQAIRQTIGYHIGSKGTMGHMTLIKEIVNNAFDEILRDYSPCNYVKIIFDERDLSLVVQDNGRGIPFDKMYNVYCEHYTSSNYNKTSGDTKTAGVNGAGGKLVFALSNYFRVESYILGEARYIEAKEGVIKSKQPKSIKNNGFQGTIVKFTPSEILGEVTTTCDMVYVLVYSLFPLLPIGSIVDFTGIDVAGTVKYNESRTNNEGITAALIDTVETPLIAPIYFNSNNGVCSVEVCFTYDAKNFDPEIITSYANFCITSGGTHVDGFMDAICNYFRNYMNKIYLGEKSKITIVNNDIKTGLRAVVNASHINPVFNAQAKEILRNEDMYPFIRSVTTNYLNEWIKTNSASLNKLCKYFKDVAELRMKSDDTKIKLSNKYQTSLLSGKPKKYLAPSGHKGLELFIVEGDSAAGGARVGRNSDTQGVFPIRGKLINAFSTTKAKFLSNQEVASIITLVGGGYGKNFDITKVPWDKIIIMCLSGDTEVKMLGGFTMTLEEMYKFEQEHPGSVYPMYGYNTLTGTIVPVQGVNPRITKFVNELVEISLDNGQIIKCTPDHLILTKEYGYVQACELMEGVSLMPLYTRTSTSSSYKGREEVFSNYEWVLTHRMVGHDVFNKDIDDSSIVFHHIDEDKNNNNPYNLNDMGSNDHIILHNRSESKKSAQSIKMSNHHKNGLYKDTSYFIKYNKTENNSTITAEMNKDPEIIRMQQRGKFIRLGASLVKDNIILTPSVFTINSNEYIQLKQNHIMTDINKIFKYFDSFEEFVILSVNYAETSLTTAEYNAHHCTHDDKNRYSEISIRSKRTMIAKIINDMKLNNIEFNEDNYNTCRINVSPKAPVFNKINKYFINPINILDARNYYNHKVVSVRLLKYNEPIPVYDITVPDFHNFAIVSRENPDTGVFVHNCDADPRPLGHIMVT